MTWLVEASQARHSGALTDYLGLLPALDSACDEASCTFLVSDALARRLAGRIEHAELIRPGTGLFDRLGRLLLNRPLRCQLRRRTPDAILFGQYAPVAVRVPYVLRMTDAHLVDTPGLERVLPFYSPVQRLRWQARLATFRRSVRGASAVLCATRAVRDQLLETVPEIDPERVLTAPFGPPPAIGAVRHPGARRRRLLTMHASPRKNIEVVLAALRRPELDGWTLTVLADLERPTDPYTRFLADRIADLGLEDRVRSEGYIHDPGRLTRCMLDHDVFVAPSRIESWSHTVVEALAMRMPVIASDIPCHREVAGGGAWLAPVDDPEAWADAALEIADGGDEVEGRLDRGIETVRGYSWERHAAEAGRALELAAANPR